MEASDHEAHGARYISGPSANCLSGTSTELFGSVVATTMNRLAMSGDPPPVDAVFVLGKGAAINFGNGQGVRRLRLDGGEDATGWAWVEGNPSLLEFLGWLHALPRVDHQGSMLLSYLSAAAEHGDGVMVAVPQPGMPEEQDANDDPNDA
jgi:hypothetical protein